MAKASDVLMEHEKDGPRASDELTGTGSAMLTKKLRMEYGDYNTNAQEKGENPMAWAEWLRPDYELDKRGLAYRVK